MKKEKKSFAIVPYLIGLGLILLATLGGWIYYNATIRRSGLEKMNNPVEYEKQFAMIVDNQDSPFWQSVYESAAQEAASANALLEYMGTSTSSDYTQEDMMEMCIAESVDGILLQYNGDAKLQQLIDKAVKRNIPVVTISEDAPQSKRQSFVGVNTYQLGEAYSKQVISLMSEDTKKVMILTANSNDESNQKLLAVQIRNAVTQNVQPGQNVSVEVKNVNARSSFDSEETIRNIFLTTQGPPDILVCMDEVDTECAYQAIVDYNQVGLVSIVGYYTTSSVLEGIQKGIIPATIELDADQMGKSGIDALNEFIQEERVSDYFSVDVNVITSENVEEYIVDDEKMED